ncbi:hypothetical protein MMC28_009921 [Mycoblastus sanguinarius]|nr:hypothetical protein [Mycoblastus sanguinarius]
MFLFERAAALASTLTNTQRGKGCVAYDPTAKAPTYGYVPNLAPGIVFSIVFFLSLSMHIFQTIRSRKWWYSSLALGAFGECLGWAGRTGSHYCPYNSSLFSLQISILIISPCFFSAGLYYILGQMINQYGQRYSPISARTYLYIFIGFDIMSIVIQAVGGGLASSAGSKTPPGNTATGAHIMLAGIIIQLVSMSVFAILFVTFLWLARAIPISRILILSTTFSAFCIMVRNYYRSVELGQGWNGYLISHEVYFTVLDGALMALATLILNIYYPATYLSGVPEMSKRVSSEDIALKNAV